MEGIMEEESWRRNPGGGIMKEEMEEESWEASGKHFGSHLGSHLWSHLDTIWGAFGRSQAEGALKRHLEVRS